MALIPSARYPTQTSTADADGYPYGEAQNEATFNDGTGTPYEKDVVNDIWGFLQALLVETGIEPSGTPDKADASQYKAAIEQMIAETGNPLSSRVATLEAVARRPGFFMALGGSMGPGDQVGFAETADPAADYTLHDSGGDVEVDRNGYYWVDVCLNISSADEGVWGFKIRRGSTTIGQFKQHFTGGEGQISGRALVQITDHDTQRINVQGTGVASAVATVDQGYLTVEPAR